MSSTEQILANRQNSLLSTGPCSEAGKLASAKNAISHGLSSAGDPVLPHEDRAQFNALLDRYKLDFSPANAHEEFLIVTMVGARWRLARAGRIENAILGEMLDSPEAAMAQSIMNKEGDALARLDRHRANIERTYHRCTRELYASQKWNIDTHTTQLAEKKFNNLVHDYIDAPLPTREIRPAQNKANPPSTFIRSTPKTGRNDSCPCGSGLKFKKCCLLKLDTSLPIRQSA